MQSLSAKSKLWPEWVEFSNWSIEGGANTPFSTWLECAVEQRAKHISFKSLYYKTAPFGPSRTFRAKKHLRNERVHLCLPRMMKNQTKIKTKITSNSYYCIESINVCYIFAFWRQPILRNWLEFGSISSTHICKPIIKTKMLCNH